MATRYPAEFRERAVELARLREKPVKQRCYPMLGFGSMESAKRFCSAFDELRQYLRIRPRFGEQVSLSERRRVFLARWQALTTEMAAA